MPRPPVKTERLEIRITAELLDRIDAWIAAQPIRPSRAAALSYLIEYALKAAPLSPPRAPRRQPK